MDEKFSVRPNRPKTFAHNLTIPQKVTNVSIYAIYDNRAGIPIKLPAWLVRRSGRDGGGKSQPDYGLLNLAFWPLNVVEGR